MTPLSPGSEIELVIDSLSNGQGIARTDGQVCFVEGALPGETVRARISVAKKRYLEAKTVEVLKASPHREEPPCVYVSECGGCQYQHMAYSEELRWKEIQVRETLERIGKVTAGRYEPIVSGAEPYGYRSSITLHQGVFGKQRGWGFFAKGSKSIVGIDRCLIADPAINETLSDTLKKTHPSLASITLKKGSDGQVVTNLKETFFKIRVLGQTFWVNSQGFFQVNVPVAEQLVTQVKNWISEYRDVELFDLYAGVGLFGILCGADARAVCVVESDRNNMTALRRNFRTVQKRGCRIVKGQAEYWAESLLKEEPKGARIVIVDPPRAGLDRKLATLFSKEKSIDAIVYVSCDGASLARDLGVIMSGGLYRLDCVAPFDMFPRTQHVEVAALLKAVRPA